MPVPRKGAVDFLNWLSFMADPKALAELKDTIAKFAEAEKELEERTKIVEQHEAAVVKREEQANHILTQEAQRNNDIERRAIAVQRDAETLQIKNGMINKERQALDERLAALEARETECDSHQKELMQWQSELAARATELTELQTKLNADRASLDSREAKLRSALG